MAVTKLALGLLNGAQASVTSKFTVRAVRGKLGPRTPIIVTNEAAFLKEVNSDRLRHTSTSLWLTGDTFV